MSNSGVTRAVPVSSDPASTLGVPCLGHSLPLPSSSAGLRRTPNKTPKISVPQSSGALRGSREAIEAETSPWKQSAAHQKVLWVPPLCACGSPSPYWSSGPGRWYPLPLRLPPACLPASVLAQPCSKIFSLAPSKPHTCPGTKFSKVPMSFR